MDHAAVGIHAQAMQSMAIPGSLAWTALTEPITLTDS
jgi:hypothetical protein